MDDLQKMLLKERQQKDKEAEQDMMQRMQYLQKTVSSDQREDALKKAIAQAAENSRLKESGQEGREASELLQAEQTGTPEQQERFKRLRDTVLKQKYPGVYK